METALQKISGHQKALASYLLPQSLSHGENILVPTPAHIGGGIAIDNGDDQRSTISGEG
jgi:hypothetical protein